jgi:hypothetical protein
MTTRLRRDDILTDSLQQVQVPLKVPGSAAYLPVPVPVTAPGVAGTPVQGRLVTGTGVSP